MAEPKNTRAWVFRAPWVRSALGGLLVVGSVAGVFQTLNSGSETMTVLVANAPLVQGTLLDDGDISAISVPAHAVFDGALQPADVSGRLFLTSPVAAGGIIPRAFVSSAPDSDDTTVTVELAVGQPVWLRPGAVAELWVSPPEGANGFGAPFVVSPTVVLTAVTRDEGFAANALSSRVDILIPRRDLPGVIHALANGFFITLTPVTVTGQ